jgi:hypothetical protein
MKKWGIALAVIAVSVALWFILHKPSASGTQQNAPQGSTAAEDAAVARALAQQNPGVTAVINSNFARVQVSQNNPGSAATASSPAPQGTPAPLQFTNFPPEIVLENMGRAVRQYGQMFSGNPVGTNPEITSQLNGNNPRHINFINAEAGMRVNENGELVDAWGTPYFFHQLSGTDMEIHSAGPDRIMWTADDLVSK